MSDPTSQGVPAPTAPDLTRFAWLSVAAAVATIALKAGAFLITGSVGLLSDAAESVVNLVAAVAALVALRVAVRPADDGHQFGHGKAEYFSAGLEGLLILVAAVGIGATAVPRLLHPEPLSDLGAGLAVAAVASVLNGAVAAVLLRAGARYRSRTLSADGHHLLTDVWTSVGVIAGVLLVLVTGQERLDPLVAVAVAVNIAVTGYKLLSTAVLSLLDGALPEADVHAVVEVLDRHAGPEVSFHGLSTRESGRDRFVALHVLVPGEWPVRRGHDLVERIEADIRTALPDTTVHAHLEAREDERSYDDYAFDCRPGRWGAHRLPSRPGSPQS